MRIAMILTLLPSIALAQTNDLEYRDVDVPQSKKKLEVSGFFETQWHEWDNIDFRKLDESSDQAILDSDDRASMAFTGAALNLAYDPDPQLRFVLGASHRGLWGADQFGGTNVYGGWVYFNAAFVEYRFGTGEHPVTARVGRQFYKLGGLGKAPDFMLADVLDMVRVDFPIGEIGKVTVIPINVVSTAQSSDGANFASFNAQSTIQTFGFRGDRMTRRHGIVLDLDKLGPIGLKAYGFYTDLGALGTGSDISYQGLLGNFSDNDWIANLGLRAQGTFGPITPYLGIDASTGIDRKELVARDVDTNGFAVTAGASLDLTDKETKDGLSANAYFYYSLGATYADDGLLTSHGYVGMKAQQVGGLLANRYLGWHPSAYAGLFGVSDTPQQRDRKSGTQVIHANVKYEMGPVYGSVAWWMMSDTGFTNFNFDNINTTTPPFGYAREGYAAEIRLGRQLGQEIDLSLGVHLHKRVDFYASGAILLPGEYYGIPIARVAGTALGSTDPQMPWGFMSGIRVKL